MIVSPAPRRHRILRFVPAPLAAVLIAGCVSSAGPGVRGPEAAALFARYTGSWVLVPEESVSPEQALGRQGAARRPRGGEGTGFLPPQGGGGGGRGGQGGGGGGGGEPPTGPIPGGDPGAGPRRGGPRGTDGARREPEGPQGDPGLALAQLVGPTAFDLAVTDSTFLLTPRPSGAADSVANRPRPTEPPPFAPGRPDATLSVRLDGKAVEGPDGPGRVEIKGGWRNGIIQVERKVEDGPSEKESWTVDARGLLVVTQTIELPRGPKFELKRVYRRSVTD